MTASSDHVAREEFDTFKRETQTAAERADIRLQVVSMDLLSLNRLAADQQEGLGQLREEVDALRGEVGELRAEVGELRAEVGELRGEVGELRAEVSALRDEVGRTHDRLDAHERRLDELHDAFLSLSNRMDQGFAGLTTLLLQLPRR